MTIMYLGAIVTDQLLQSGFLVGYCNNDLSVFRTSVLIVKQDPEIIMHSHNPLVNNACYLPMFS